MKHLIKMWPDMAAPNPFYYLAASCEMRAPKSCVLFLGRNDQRHLMPNSQLPRNAFFLLERICIFVPRFKYLAVQSLRLLCIIRESQSVEQKRFMKTDEQQSCRLLCSQKFRRLGSALSSALLRAGATTHEIRRSFAEKAAPGNRLFAAQFCN